MNSKNGFGQYICLDCNEGFTVQRGVLQKRHFRCGEPVCKKCYKKTSRGGKYLDFYPEELKPILKDDVWDLEKIRPFLNRLGRCKRKVKFICQECNHSDIMTISAMRIRKICGFKPICKKCSLKFATNSEMWKASNSKAQIIAQNRPSVLKKQRDAQLRLMKNDPLYAEKRCSKSYISGTIKGMRFDSSWELYFIVYCWESKKIKRIDRYDGFIEYFDTKDKKRRYYPDFVVEFCNGIKKIVEIKGTKKYNNFLDKFNAARKKLGINYVVYEEGDLKDMGIYFRRESYLKGFYKKYYSEITFYANAKTKEFKKRVEKWLR